MPPFTQIREGTRLETVVRAVRRAAAHPWRDARFWRKAAERMAAAQPAEVTGRDLAQVCLAFRRIEFFSPSLARYCELHVGERRQALNTFEIAAVASYSVLRGPSEESGDAVFVRTLFDEACADWRRREVVPWVAWRMLICAAAEANISHQILFATASPQLAQNVRLMTGRDVAEIGRAFAVFGFKHHGLLSEMSRFLPSLGLSDTEVKEVKTTFARLDFEEPMLRRMSELRVGVVSGMRL
eukprot:TRINITY_DN34475_c0_g1_i1.p1 TRINITY_DN34475_c0_g1~~TRINITY_DN34475_c0_g1_i1.p1  ORF type:complete len:272 (-),score=40.30 TRINITY_DN34475_c0_g1_i1:76-798(-)